MLLNIEIIVAVLLIIVVLLQNKNVSLNLSSMSWDMWEITKRGPEKVMQNTTIILAVAFIINSILLFITK
jgi:protein translocase SecG subunit